MARIKYSALVTSINGSIGGTTFQRNAYGFTIKQKPNMVNPNRPKQNQRKVLLGEIASHWTRMTDAQRSQWSAQATAYPQPSRLNPDSYLTGHALWLRINLLWSLTGNTIISGISNPVQDSITPNIPEVQRTGSNLIYFNDSDSQLGKFVALAFLSSPVRPTQLTDRSRTRYVGVLNLLSQDELNITAAYTSQFGRLPTAGEYVFLRTCYVNPTNGQVINYRPTLITVYP